MAGAIWLGVLQPPQNVSSQINVQCPLGNCTFVADAGAAYETIATCSSCEDISNQIVNLTESDDVLNYTLPASSEMTNNSLNIGRSTVFMSRTADTSDLFAFESIMLSQEDPSCNTTNMSCGMKPLATRCLLNPCAQSYTATIKDFRLDEQVVSSTNLVYDAHSHGTLGSFSLVANSTIRNGIRHECVKTEQKTLENTIPLTENNTIVTATYLRNITQWTSPQCFFQFDSSSKATTDFLRDMYHGKSLSIAYGRYTRPLGDLWIKRFYNKGTANLTTTSEYMNGLATAMSAHMRKDLDASQDALGQVFAQQTCVRINWAWITLPASLVLMAILFLAATMWSTLTQAWHGMWKSSALALVFVSIASESLLHKGVLNKKSQIADTAQDMRAKFLKTERGWGFVEH
jgi:hypothetical protein